MKNYKKILTVFGLLLTVLILVGCGRKPNETFQHLIYDVNPNDLVVEELNDSTSISSLYFYDVLFEGQTNQRAVSGAGRVEYYDETNTLLTSHLGAVKKVYYYDLTGIEEEIEIVQYKQGSQVTDYLYIDYLDVSEDSTITRNGATLTESYIFTGENIDFYLIGSTGVEEIDYNEITFTGFPEGDDLFTENGKSYRSDFNALVTAEYEGLESEFVVRLFATIKPIHHKTATFWNWIFLKMPIAYLMSFVGSIFNNSFALAILITTIIIRTLFWPIYAKTNDMTLKMNIAQPDLDKLQRKYATRKDPESQQKMQMEMMQIYKKHNINFLGCLLPFLQMPIFLGMYQVVREITIPGGQFYESVSNTKFFLSDLTTGGVVAKLVFTALVGITMFALQKISQIKPKYAKKSPPKANPQGNQQQQTMKMVSFVMIFMMVMTAYITPGLALSYYWIIGNIYSMGQTLFNRYISEKKFEKLQEEKLYGKSREIIDAQFKGRGEK